MSATDLSSMPFEALARKFEDSITFDAHSFRARFERSDERKEFSRRGFEALGDVVAFVEAAADRLRGTELEIAWLKLIHWIGWSDEGSDRLISDSSLPHEYRNIDAWLACARGIRSAHA